MNIARVFLPVFLTLGVAGCVRETNVEYSDNLVKITEHRRINLLNVHGGDDVVVMEIWGQEFPEIRGCQQRYLRIPGRPQILFVTGKTFDRGQATVHLADLKSEEIVQFPAHDSRIGALIGQDSPTAFERIVKLEGDKLVIEAKDYGSHAFYFIDLSVPMFEREEVDYPLLVPPAHVVREEGREPDYPTKRKY